MYLADLTWPAVARLDRAVPVVFPVAAIEQHGPHLPLFTDSMLLGEIVRRAEQRLADRVLFAPLMWLGNSHHHLDFPGTLSASPRTYLGLLADMLDNLITHGFRRLVVLNGHGGNDIPSQQVVFELRQRHRQREDLLIVCATYWSLGGQPHMLPAQIQQRRMGHACEWETSMMLWLAPNLVGEVKGLRPVPIEDPLAPAVRGWTTRERTREGYLGIPAQASAEKGNQLFTLFAQDVVQLLEKVIAWDGGPGTRCGE